VTQPSTPTYTLADSARTWGETVRHLSQVPRLGLDTEADSRHHYPEKVCLLQVSTPRAVYVVDPLARLDMAPLAAVLDDPRVEKVLHGADFDLRGMHRDWGHTVRGLYDTNVAARFAGLERLGLAALLEDLLGLSIPKEERLQRADWSRRPLSAEALAYAAGDVAHLFALRDALDAKLGELGRRAWAAEEFERLEQVRYAPPDAETAFLNVKGSHRLSPQGLSVLRELHAVREAEALRLDRPPGFIVNAETLVRMASKPETPLSEVAGLSPAIVRRMGRSLEAALERGRTGAPYRRPAPEFPPRPRPTNAERNRLAKLKEWRMGLGKQLAMDPALCWPARSLERLAREPGTLDAELDSPEVRRWQRETFGLSLRSALDAAR
jgi:ribonuclease D